MTPTRAGRPRLSGQRRPGLTVHEAAADCPFRLVESLVAMWSVPPGPQREALPGHVADAGLRVLGVPPETGEQLRVRSAGVIARFAAPTLSVTVTATHSTQRRGRVPRRRSLTVRRCREAAVEVVASGYAHR